MRGSFIGPRETGFKRSHAYRRYVPGATLRNAKCPVASVQATGRNSVRAEETVNVPFRNVQIKSINNCPWLEPASEADGFNCKSPFAHELKTVGRINYYEYLNYLWCNPEGAVMPGRMDRWRTLAGMCHRCIWKGHWPNELVTLR